MLSILNNFMTEKNMSENHSKENKPKVIGLKGGSSTVKQSFSHGRSKSVVVETKKKKVFFTNKTPEIEKKAETVSEVAVASENSANEEILRKKKAIEASKAQEREQLEKSEKDKKE